MEVSRKLTPQKKKKKHIDNNLSQQVVLKFVMV